MLLRLDQASIFSTRPSQTKLMPTLQNWTGASLINTSVHYRVCSGSQCIGLFPMPPLSFQRPSRKSHLVPLETASPPSEAFCSPLSPIHLQAGSDMLRAGCVTRRMTHATHPSFFYLSLPLSLESCPSRPPVGQVTRTTAPSEMKEAEDLTCTLTRKLLCNSLTFPRADSRSVS